MVQIGRLKAEVARLGVRLRAAREAADGAGTRAAQLESRVTAAIQEEQGRRYGSPFLR